MPVKIGIVAGEMSGDLLGAGLITHLRNHFPDAEFQGLGGERMIAEGFASLFALERLSIMGFVEPLKRLPELLRIRRTLYRHFIDWGADIVIGIDSPDFNLGLELKLRKKGVLTAHYVSPSVWAWRQGRVRKIARAVDRMLTLLPFEAEFYRQHEVPVSFVGHPLADEIPLHTDTLAARETLGLDAKQAVLAVMPGSRGGEIQQMCRLFLDVVGELKKQSPRLQVLIPSANPQRHREIEAQLAGVADLGVRLVAGNAHTVMAAADAVLLTSGTTALEAMLLNKPMVVAYRMGGASYWLVSRLVKAPFISLPNLIAGRALVPELIQDNATIENLTRETATMLFDEDKRGELSHQFRKLHAELKMDASERAAAVVAEMINARRAD